MQTLSRDLKDQMDRAYMAIVLEPTTKSSQGIEKESSTNEDEELVEDPHPLVQANNCCLIY